MLVANDVRLDSRVQKAAYSAAEAGYDVLLLGYEPSRKGRPSDPAYIGAAQVVRTGLHNKWQIAQWPLKDAGALVAPDAPVPRAVLRLVLRLPDAPPHRPAHQGARHRQRQREAPCQGAAVEGLLPRRRLAPHRPAPALAGGQLGGADRGVRTGHHPRARHAHAGDRGPGRRQDRERDRQAPQGALRRPRIRRRRHHARAAPAGLRRPGGRVHPPGGRGHHRVAAAGRVAPGPLRAPGAARRRGQRADAARSRRTVGGRLGSG